MDLDSFLDAPVHEVAELVRSKGPRVVVLPVNGTRRWFMLEQQPDADFLQAILRRYQELFSLLFSHGVSTLLTPIVGPDIVQRGEPYTRMILKALGEISQGEEFSAFYRQFDVRVRFYGEYEAYFQETAPEFLAAAGHLAQATRDHLQHRLFWGMFAGDPTEWIARTAVAYQEVQGRTPQRSDLVSRYYGEFLPPADIFIGMQPPVVFDYPLLDAGDTALYFTAAPTPYLTETTLRRILHDYLFVRPVAEAYDTVPQETWDALRDFYETHAGDVAGVGRRSAGGHFWLPTSGGTDGE